MMTISKKILTRQTAWLLLMAMCLQLCFPLAASALTSGPTQPEAQSFQPASVSDMVDLFSGDLKYNVPLFDLDGYPVNLNYSSGIGMDDEASWVGLGWNLNVGAINRQLRGIPDDFAGDSVTVNNETKPKITVGGKVTAKAEFFGKARLGGSFTLGVFSDNYTGVGAEIGVNAGLSFSLANSSKLNAGLGLGILSNTNSGVDVTPSMSLNISAYASKKLTVRSGLTATLGYNTRSGVKDLTLGTSFSATKTQFKDVKIDMPPLAQIFQGLPPSITVAVPDGSGTTNFSTAKSSISYNTEPISPDIQIPYKSTYGSFSFDIGGVVGTAFLGGGVTGYRNVREIREKTRVNKQYGFLYAEKGKDQKDAILDFQREQDNLVTPELPNIAIPIQTPDLFSYTGQSESGQFKLYRGGTGMYFDNETKETGEVSTAGFDLGFGAYGHGGVSIFEQNMETRSGKWTRDNAYLGFGDFQSVDHKRPEREHVAFRQIGERFATNLNSKLTETRAQAIGISGINAQSSLLSSLGTKAIDSAIQKGNRTPAVTSIGYLTAKEAEKGGRTGKIYSYPSYTFGSFVPPSNHIVAPSDSMGRVSDYRKGHHISEMTVTNNQGVRSVYGLPVYNIKQQEYTFAIGKGYTKFNGNQTNFTIDGAKPFHKKGIDHYYLREQQPAHATSYLLTEVLSADYIDRGKRGISEEDAGSAIKFNYSKLPYSYRWRSPFPTTANGQQQNAIVNRGLLADPDDDKASIVYGEKEIWYISSIETKTKIAYFITQDRLDGLGVQGWYGGGFDQNRRLKVLKEIRLYSKANMERPIKVVVLEQDYSLCKNTPNSSASGGGKLTLNKLWFEYGNTSKGSQHPYEFSYSNMGYINGSYDGLPTNKVDSVAIDYTNMAVDRWGVYKGNNKNRFEGLNNEEFPYTPQHDRKKMDMNAALWSLNRIVLPSGGVIDIDYESDDYAYVQNRRAMEMVPFERFDNDSEVSLKGARGIKLTIDTLAMPNDVAKRPDWFKRTFLNGSEYLYTKFCVRMANNQNPADPGADDKDFVSTYCKVGSISVSGNIATILFEDINESSVVDNPVRFAAWQNVRLSYPRYAYPGFRNRIDDDSQNSAIEAVTSAIANSVGNLSELTENFYQKARRKDFSHEVVKAKSFVRLAKADGRKVGGGLRVKRIRVGDQWKMMAGDSAAATSYGQSYEYTTQLDGRTISSGVATYEPSVGTDENPMKMPIKYVQKITGSINNLFELTEPFAESLFPAPGVGYSRVTVRDLDRSGLPDPNQRTGYQVTEYYTAKDFPVQVHATPLQRHELRKKSLFSLVKSDSHHESVLSQGYYIRLNDMHGKGKAELVYNQSDNLIQSTRYFYKTKETAPGELVLDNEVDVVNNNMVYSTTIGREVEFYTDFREQETINAGTAVNLGADLVPLFGIPFPFPHVPIGGNNDYSLFRSASAMKVDQYYGIMSRVEKMVNGSTTATENLVYDAHTGEPVVSKTNNEFKRPVYTVLIPAHWTYKGMSGSYKNIGALVNNFSYEDKKLSGPVHILHEGDELLNLDTGELLWVIDDGEGNKNLINREGYAQNGSKVRPDDIYKILRSGYRNQLAPMTSSFTSLENPIVNGKLVLGDLTNRSLKATAASFTSFSEDWYPEPSRIKMDTLDIPGKRYLWAVINTGSDTTIYEGDNEISHFVQFRIDFTASKSATDSGEDPYEYTGPIVLKDESNLPVHYTVPYTLNVDGQSSFEFTPAYRPQWEGRSLETQLHIATGVEDFYETFFYPQRSWAKNMGEVEFGTDTIMRQKPVNPYVMGYKGNWRQEDNRTFLSEREDHGVLSSRSANVLEGGYLKGFHSLWFWNENPIGKWVYHPIGSQKWKSTNTVSIYDRYGQELENRDGRSVRYMEDVINMPSTDFENQNALRRHKSASYDFNGSLPSAVVANAMQREIYANGFEDIHFRSTHFDDKKELVDFRYGNQGLDGLLNLQEAHSGNYSLNLPASGIIMQTIAHFESPGFYPNLVLNDNREYLVRSDKFFWGFEPMPRKKYLFTVWVKDSAGNSNKNIPIQLEQNSQPVTLSCRAVVEKWKKIEGEIELTTFNPLQALTLKLSSTAPGVKIDDLRIHPFNADMKTYAYDDKNYRVMAELDENAFASFYEYDDEGALVRVKKETEKGIVTLKESRSSYVKR